MTLVLSFSSSVCFFFSCLTFFVFVFFSWFGWICLWVPTCVFQGHLDAGHIVVTGMFDPALTQFPFDRIMPVIGTRDFVVIVWRVDFWML